MTAPIRALAACITLLTGFVSTSAVAEEAGRRNVMIGSGVQSIPSYPGADSNSLGFLPLFDSWREGEPMPVESPDEAFGFALIGKRGGFAVGPAVTFAATRAADDIPGLAKVGFGVEAGAFVEVWPAAPLRLRAELRQGIGAHKALTGDLAADLVWRRGLEGPIATLGPRLRWGSAKHNRAYFGVPTPSPVPTFAVYEPGGGIYAVGVVAGLRLPLTPKFGLYSYLGYDRLSGPAADSPIVSAGRRDQYAGGVALTYRFGL